MDVVQGRAVGVWQVPGEMWTGSEVSQAATKEQAEMTRPEGELIFVGKRAALDGGGVPRTSHTFATPDPSALRGSKDPIDFALYQNRLRIL